MYLKKKKKEPAPWRQNILTQTRIKPKRGDATRVTPAVREEVNRRSMDIWRSSVPVCERCGTTLNLTKAHLINASQGGTGRDPRNIMNLCGTHGWKGSCHDYCDNERAGIVFKQQYGEFLQGYYSEGKGKNHWKEGNWK